jgi:arylsulfatase A-like enzyme
LTLDEVKAGHKRMDWVPLMRDEEIIEYPADQTTLTQRYTEEAIRFIESQKDAPFFLYLPHTMVHLPLAVSPAFAGRTEKLIWDAIEEVDWSVGEILRAVAKAGIDENTLIIFTSDNGAAVGSSLPLRSRKGSVYDGGIREPTLMQWKGHIPAGSICREVVASVDILPTLAYLAGGKLPDREIDGHNIWPLMHGEVGAKSPHAAWCLMHGPGTVRSGKWKYYPWQEGKHHQDRPQKQENLSEHPVQLYNTRADIGETTNVAAEHPEIVQRLQAAYEAQVADIEQKRRPTAKLLRPPGSLSPARPKRNQ